MMRKVVVAAVLLVAGIFEAPAQRIGIAYWNVEPLCDTLPSPFCNDADYTPRGRYRWTTERYRRKTEAVAAAIDSMAQPVVMLYGVENESVVRDIAAACTNDYSYIHRTMNSRDGLDFALLYFGDALRPDSVAVTGRNMVVRCRVAGRRTVLLMSRHADDAERLARQIRRERPDDALIAAGRLRPDAMRNAGLSDAFAAEERAGRGERMRGGVWRFDERICTDTLLAVRTGVYARRELFDRTGRAPLPTVVGNRYVGGTSRSLPMFVTVGWPDEAETAEKNGEKVGDLK